MQPPMPQTIPFTVPPTLQPPIQGVYAMSFFVFFTPTVNTYRWKAVKRNIREDIFGVNYKHHHDKNNMDQALINRFYAILASNYKEDLCDSIITLPNPTFITTFKHAVTKWGQSNPSLQNTNKKTMLKP